MAPPLTLLAHHAELIAALRALLASPAGPARGDAASSAREAIDRASLVRPAHCYDPANWDTTHDWVDRVNLAEEIPLGAVMEIATLHQGAPAFAALVVLTRDLVGDPDETELRFYPSRAEAEAAASGADTGQSEEPTGAVAHEQ